MQLPERPATPANASPDPSVAPFIPGPQTRLIIMALGGALGGYVLGKAAYEHLFVEGLTDDERKGFFLMGAAGAAVWAAQTFFDIDKRFYAIETLPSTAQQIYSEIIK